MLTLSLQEILTAILLIALIVLVIFLIVLVSKTTDSVKKANTILDSGMSAAESAKKKVEGVTSNIASKKAKLEGLTTAGSTVVKTVVEKVINK